MNVIELEGIKRYYRLAGKKKKGGAKNEANSEEIIVRALRGLDLSAGAGEFISVMGPSGSGKSTLMNILGCLDRPDEGSYRLDGIETSTSNSNTFAFIRNKKIGFVFQAFNLLARTSALENVELPLSYNRSGKSSGKANRERAAAVLGEVGLGDRMDILRSTVSKTSNFEGYSWPLLCLRSIGHLIYKGNTRTQMKRKRINKKIFRVQETCYSTVKLCIKFLLRNGTAKYRMFHISGAKLAHRFHISSLEFPLMAKNTSSYFVFGS